jgi:hypothetical protein
MRRLLFAVSFVVALLHADGASSKDYFQQAVDYTIQVRLDTKNHMLTGTERISYTNNSPDTLEQFFLHLYPNAFQSKHTALMKDYRKQLNGTFLDLPEKYRGYLNIYDVKVDGAGITPRVDDTIAEMDLPRPLAPGQSMEISLRFEEKIRRQIDRAGYEGDQYDLAQWYPKVVVYDENGFHPDKFRWGEFYGEFGTFDVSIEVPDRYVIAATGELKEGDAGWTLNSPDDRNGRSKPDRDDTQYKTVLFHAENVHDFAWNASPRFAVQDTTWNGIQIRSFFNMGNEEWKDSTLVHGVRAMEWLSRRVGAYPYPQLSIVQCLMGGGMEYPMLVMDSDVSESLVLHEVGHIWFYGILANDERAEAWLDEGFATYMTGRYLAERYGEYGDTGEWSWYQRMTPQYTLAARQRREVLPLLRQGYGERIATRAEDFKHDYFAMVYEKAALMLDALRYVVGDDDFDKILKEYFERWRFKHVNEARFQAVCEEVSGEDLHWFFEQWLHTKGLCDYRLSEMKTAKNEKGDGYVTRVKIERLGEMTMPLVLEFTFADGSRDTTRIPGRLRTIEETYNHAKKPKKAALNPKNEILDINLSDNVLPRRYAFRIDWPKNDYYPEDAYQIRHHPFVWYNDVDGARLGYGLAGSNHDWSRRLKLGVYYGTQSRRLDFAALYERPSIYLGKRTTLAVSGYKVEGRQDASIGVSYRRRTELSRPPTHNFTAGFNYHELREERYSPDSERYQKHSDMAPYLRYKVDPQFDLFGSEIDVGLRFGREWFGGRYKYSRFETSAALKSRPLLVPVDARLRFFIGLADRSAPYQQKFYLAGGGPLAEENLFFLRSPGAIPEDLNYHESGGGNLRGYFEGDFGVNRLLALNFEVGGPIPLLSRDRKTFLGRIKAMAFADVGRSFDSVSPIGTSARVTALFDQGVLDETIVDAGIGFTLARDLPFWDLFLRFDIPFYVNQPQINGETEETDFRYVFSLKSSF